MRDQYLPENMKWKLLKILEYGINIYQKNTSLNFGNMGSISIKNMKWTFGNRRPISIKNMNCKFGNFN